LTIIVALQLTLIRWICLILKYLHIIDMVRPSFSLALKHSLACMRFKFNASHRCNYDNNTEWIDASHTRSATTQRKLRKTKNCFASVRLIIQSKLMLRIRNNNATERNRNEGFGYAQHTYFRFKLMLRISAYYKANWCFAYAQQRNAQKLEWRLRIRATHIRILLLPV